MKYIFQRRRVWLPAVLCLTASCATRHFMYAPAAVNTPSFTGEGQSYAGLAASYHGLDATGGYSVSDHLGVLASWYWRRETHYDKAFHQWGNHGGPGHFDSILYKRHFAALGLTYYTPLDKRNHFSFNTTVSYGRGRFFMEENAKTKEWSRAADSLVTVNHYFRYNARMHRFCIQPAVLIHEKEDDVSASASVRWTGIVYSNNRGTTDPDKYGRVSNRLLSYIEPTLTIRFLVKDWWHLTFQGGISLNTQSIDYQYRPIIANVGVEIDPASLFRRHPEKMPSSGVKIISL